ncbi:MAG: LURP-one-related family protein [Acidobacteria bacterium]|nr:LURP-one-related family protein [Acidobacteriota bacterium]MBI3426279.1 LURP-one-related family protein [Acidobacteriota bacterium]
MRYLMKQKLFSFGADFYIKDEKGNNAFYVDGKAVSLGDRFSLQDCTGKELASIKQKLLALTPSYEIQRDGELYAVVKKDFFNFFICGYTVDVPGPNAEDDLRAEGSLFEHEYEFKRSERVVATVTKRWFSWTDSYGVEIAPGEDDVLILASTVVIDAACHDERAKGHATE